MGAAPDTPAVCLKGLQASTVEPPRLRDVTARHCMRPHHSLRSTIRGDQLALVHGFASEYSNAGLPEAWNAVGSCIGLAARSEPCRTFYLSDALNNLAQEEDQLAVLDRRIKHLELVLATPPKA